MTSPLTASAPDRIRTCDLRFRRPSRWIGGATWSAISSGLRRIPIGRDRLESVGRVAPFVAPAERPVGAEPHLPCVVEFRSAQTIHQPSGSLNIVARARLALVASPAKPFGAIAPHALSTVDVNANIRTIESVLTGGYYRVPDFQRPYSWDTSNVEDLWDDIKESQRDYFIGSMVVFADNASSGLIDGQQRLTTITMMLAAIRNELEVLDADEEAAGIHTLIERKDSKGKGRFVLQAEASYPYLHAAIQAKPGDAQPVAAARIEDKSLEAAFGLLVERTRSIRSAAEANSSLSAAKQRKQAKTELEALRDKVYALTVVLVEVDDETDATTIFQTLNSRGKDLDTADLVKAHLLHMLKSTNAQLNQARDTWGEIRSRFDGASTPINMNRFLLHAWLSREDYVGGKDLFAKIKKKVRSNNAQDYLTDLDDDSQRYRAAQEPSFRAWKKPQLPVRMSLEAMSLFRLQ